VSVVVVADHDDVCQFVVVVICYGVDGIGIGVADHVADVVVVVVCCGCDVAVRVASFGVAPSARCVVGRVVDVVYICVGNAMHVVGIGTVVGGFRQYDGDVVDVGVVIHTIGVGYVVVVRVVMCVAVTYVVDVAGVGCVAVVGSSSVGVIIKCDRCCVGVGVGIVFVDVDVVDGVVVGYVDDVDISFVCVVMYVDSVDIVITVGGVAVSTISTYGGWICEYC